MAAWYSIVGMFFPQLLPHVDGLPVIIKKFNFSVHFWRCNSNKTFSSQITGSKNQCICSFFEYFQISHYNEYTFFILASKLHESGYSREPGQQELHLNLNFCDSKGREMVLQCNFTLNSCYFK